MTAGHDGMQQSLSVRDRDRFDRCQLPRSRLRLHDALRRKRVMRDPLGSHMALKLTTRPASNECIP
jgi:hypothetical protein